MARPTIPESEKRRTVPFRMSKPDYRALTAIMKITDLTIQEHLRNALNEYIASVLPILRKQLHDLPTPIQMGSWSDDAYREWFDALGTRSRTATPKLPPTASAVRPAARKGISKKPAALVDDVLLLITEHPHHRWTEAKLASEIGANPVEIRNMVKYFIKNRILRREGDLLKPA